MDTAESVTLPDKGQAGAPLKNYTIPLPIADIEMIEKLAAEDDRKPAAMARRIVRKGLEAVAEDSPAYGNGGAK